MYKQLIKMFGFSFMPMLAMPQNTIYPDKTNNTHTMYKPIEFYSEGATLRGRFYVPDQAPGKYPVIIMAHGFSATIEGMVADRYAEVFKKAGFAVILYDHRNLGISDGEPRQQLNRWTQARGYRDAINFALTQPETDPENIALWGESMSADEAIVVAAIDHRVKVVVVQVPACGRTLPPEDPDGKLFAALKETFLHSNIEATPETTVGPKPVVSFDQNTVPALLEPLTAFRWFMEYGARYNTGWVNNATYVNPIVPVKFSSVIAIPHIKAAILMMVSYDDEMPGANTMVARRAYELAPEPKKLIQIDGGHFGIIHYPSPLFDMATGEQIKFLRDHLSMGLKN
ncbi:MAG: acetylxylan esterase [Saprospiraceae bacterium]|nr:acetylxylan esterase [Saprospiraceae bacterium]